MEHAHDEDPEVQIPLMQQCVQVQGQPEKVRMDFVKKVLVIMFLQALISFGVAFLFLFKRLQTLQSIFNWCHCFHAVSTFSFAAIIVVQFVHFSYMTRWMLRWRSAYIWLLTRTPWNFLYLTIYSLLSGLLVGFSSLGDSGRMVGTLSLVFPCLVLVSTAYALWANRDWSTMDLSQAFQIVMIASVVGTSWHGNQIVSRGISIYWVMLLLCFLVQHTQLIFGTARPKHQAMQYSLDMYAYAAFNLFNVYATLYMFLLRVFHS